MPYVIVKKIPLSKSDNNNKPLRGEPGAVEYFTDDGKWDKDIWKSYFFRYKDDAQLQASMLRIENLQVIHT